jgi:hypothetical protein
MLGNAKSDPIVDSGWVAGEDDSPKAIKVYAAEMERLNPDKYALENVDSVSALTFDYGDNLTNPETFVETFHDAEEGLARMAEAGYKDTDFYKDMDAWLANNRPYVEDYESYVAEMDELMAEYGALEYTTESGKKIYQIDNLKDYKEARDYLLS